MKGDGGCPTGDRIRELARMARLCRDLHDAGLLDEELGEGSIHTIVVMGTGLLIFSPSPSLVSIRFGDDEEMSDNDFLPEETDMMPDYQAIDIMMSVPLSVPDWEVPIRVIPHHHQWLEQPRAATKGQRNQHKFRYPKR